MKQCATHSGSSMGMCRPQETQKENCLGSAAHICPGGKKTGHEQMPGNLYVLARLSLESVV